MGEIVENDKPSGELKALTWRHDGEVCKAVVGEYLTTQKPDEIDKRGKTQRHRKLEHNAIVERILEGEPIQVYWRRGNHFGPCDWAMPINVGSRSVERKVRNDD